VKPNEKQTAILFLAEADGYVRPSSPTHARRCGFDTVGRFSRSVKVCHDQRWLRPARGGTFVLTDAGREFVPSSPIVKPRSDGTEWARF
jgi:hypothetical protein